MSRSREELLAETARFQEILDSGVREQFAALPGVTQVSFGLKEVGGWPTDDFAVRVYVEEKLPVARLAPEHVVPATVAGVPTDVCRATALELYATLLLGGVRISNGILDKVPPTNVIDHLVGTLGFVARRDTKPYAPVMLSCAHVFGAHKGKIGDPVFHPDPVPELTPPDPGQLPFSPTRSTNRVGSVVDIQNSDYVDAAIAEVATSSCCDDTKFSHTILGLQVNGSDELTGTATAIRGVPVVKVGRKGRTVGRILDTGVEVPYRGRMYKDQIVIVGSEPGKQFAEPGDSGALIVDDKGKVVGLLMGGDPELPPGQDPSTLRIYANRIERVIGALHIWFPSHAAPAAPASVRSAAAVGRRHIVEAGWLDELVERLGGSETGRQLRDVITVYGGEIVELVNHRRRVTVAWHRGQGPTWLAAFARSARRSDYRLPVEIEGVTRAEAVAALHAVLLVEGSDELRASLRELPDFLVPALAECQSVDELLGRFEQTAEQRN